MKEKMHLLTIALVATLTTTSANAYSGFDDFIGQITGYPLGSIERIANVVQQCHSLNRVYTTANMLALWASNPIDSIRWSYGEIVDVHNPEAANHSITRFMSSHYNCTCAMAELDAIGVPIGPFLDINEYSEHGGTVLYNGCK